MCLRSIVHILDNNNATAVNEIILNAPYAYILKNKMEYSLLKVVFLEILEYSA